jgi:hypothetical protein
MNVSEPEIAAQNLPFEQWKKEIKVLFKQSPKSAPLARSITLVGNLETPSQQISESVNRSLERTTE